MSNPWTRKCINKCNLLIKTPTKTIQFMDEWRVVSILIKGEKQQSLRTSNANNHHFAKTSYTCKIQSLPKWNYLYGRVEIWNIKRNSCSYYNKRKSNNCLRADKPTSKHLYENKTVDNSSKKLWTRLVYLSYIERS